MYLLSLFAAIVTIVLTAVTVGSVLSGVGVMLCLCIMALFCVLCGLGLLIKLLGKGVFSLLKCVVFMCLLVVPAVNVFAFIVICVYSVKAIRADRVN